MLTGDVPELSTKKKMASHGFRLPEHSCSATLLDDSLPDSHQQVLNALGKLSSVLDKMIKIKRDFFEPDDIAAIAELDDSEGRCQYRAIAQLLYDNEDLWPSIAHLVAE